MLALKTDVVHTALGIVGVNLECPDSCVLGLSSGVDAFLFVDRHHLVPGEDERIVVTSAFSAVHGQDGRGTVSVEEEDKMFSWKTTNYTMLA